MTPFLFIWSTFIPHSKVGHWRVIAVLFFSGRNKMETITYAHHYLSIKAQSLVLTPMRVGGSRILIQPTEHFVSHFGSLEA